MKTKISKIFGIAFALVLVASLMLFAIPAAAGPYDDLEPAPNKWTGYTPTESFTGGYFYDDSVTAVGPMAKGIDGDLYAYVAGIDDLAKSVDGGRTWSFSKLPNSYKNTSTDAIVDMVCSSLSEDVLYVTDGNYVYKSVDGGMSFMFVAQASLEYQLMGKCGVTVINEPITCIDVAYNGANSPVVFIGTKYAGNTYDPSYPEYPNFNVVGSVYWIADESFPAEWADLQLRCYGCCNVDWQASGDVDGCYDVYSVGCSPDFATTSKVYVLISTLDQDCDETPDDPATQVVSTVGTTCSWSFVGELFYDCDEANPFAITEASRFAFPDDFTDTRSMFIGVTAWDGATTETEGGDVYLVTEAIPTVPVLDLNVQGYTSGCTGLADANICSLDIMGGTNDGSLIAGAYDTWEGQAGTEVYYSTDGGWTWDDSDKDPTGVEVTYVLWYGDSALASTSGCECAVSMSCGDEVGKYWNQISLINTDIDQTLDLSHAPGYLDGSTTMYVLTYYEGELEGCEPTVSLFRWDGTYWERVLCNATIASTATYVNYLTEELIDWVEVSPDFNDTDCLYVANTNFEMFRSIDRGCSWRQLAYPCAPLPDISAWIVVDEETVLAAGADSFAGHIYRTTRHGTRPWDDFTCFGADNGVDFDLSLPRGATSDVLFGDAAGQVFLSQDLGETWGQVLDATTGSFGQGNTYVVFDPGYGTAGDPGETMIYAAASNLAGTCKINFDSLLVKQDWKYIKSDICSASGIDIEGDPVLYVADAGKEGGGQASVTATGTIEVDCSVIEGEDTCVCDRDLVIDAVTVTPISGTFENGELIEILSYNLTCTTLCIEDACTCTIAGEIGVRGYESGAYGQIDVEDVVVMTCGTVTPVADEVLGSGTGSEVNFSGTLAHYPVCVGSLEITDGTETFTDNGDGTLTGSAGGTGTIDYDTGDWDVTFASPPASGTDNITADYNYSDACNEVGNAVVISDFLTITTTSSTAACPTGVWRTLNPTSFMPEWELLSLGTTSSLRHPAANTFTPMVYPDDLWLTKGSNVLWALDSSDALPTLPVTIWMWEDPLATPVIQVAPADAALLASTNSVTLEWERLDGARSYEVFIYSYCPTCPNNMVVFDNFTTSQTCIVVDGLTAGTTYYWKVRVAEGSPFLSKWSTLRSFDTALGSVPYLCSPICGASDIVLTTNFSWDAVAGATSYEIQIATDEAFSSIVAEGTATVNAWVPASALDYSTVYYWRVRAVNDGVAGAWSTCIFTTENAPEAPPEPVEPVEIVQTEITPTWIWVLIGIGGALTIAVIILIVTTRRAP
jgi:hypothetical protein